VFTGALARAAGENVGTYAISLGTLSAGSNYSISFTTGRTFAITKASSATVVTCPTSVVYNATAQTPCTAAYSGVGLAGGSLTVSYTANTNVGTVTASATYAGDANHFGSNDSKDFAITKATATVVITWATPQTYTGSSHPATATINGVGGETNLSPAATLEYFAGSTAGTAGSGTSTAPTNTGTYTVRASFAGNSNYNAASATKTITISKAVLTVTAANKAGQYSDALPPLTANFTGFQGGETLATSDVTGAPALSTTGASTSPAGTYPINVAIGSLASSNYTFAFVSGILTMVQENATIAYTGDTLGQTRANLTLQVTVRDSASIGYAGTNPEPSGTIGDIQKMWIRFDIYGATSCPAAGTPVASLYAQVADSGNGALNDGIGTATTTWTSSTETAYCVVASLVDDANASNGSTNQWYVAPAADTTVINFYDNTGKFVTGGGWILDPAGGGNGKGNFGFVGRYNKNNQPQGQVVYVFRGTYNGVAATYVVKSNALTALSFTPTIDANGVETYPIKATLQGKANLQINRASDGASLFSEGNATFIAAVTDSGASSGIGQDDFAITVTRSDGTQFKFVPVTKLSGGNVVVHMR
nr:MBG-2 domain-containing protein [Chloroflexota bacterium]